MTLASKIVHTVVPRRQSSDYSTTQLTDKPELSAQKTEPSTQSTEPTVEGIKEATPWQQQKECSQRVTLIIMEAFSTPN